MILLLLLNGCVRYREAYYFSPFNGNIPAYHTTPLQVDTVKTATYGGVLFGAGAANDELHDDIFLFKPSIYRSYARENCQFFYGGNLTLGNYYVNRYDTNYNSINDNLDAKLINQDAGNKFFGGLGLNAGVNYSIQFRAKHEWRIGIESSYQYEFGDYIQFRKGLNDTAVTDIHRQNYLLTLGLFTELAFKLRNGSIGFKIAMGKPLGKNYRRLYRARYEDERFPFLYFSPAFQYTNRRFTGFVQLNLATKAFHGQAGTSYRLASK